MRIEGSLRSNLLAAIASARRLRGARIHADTVEYWRRLADYGRRSSTQPLCESVGDLVSELDRELAHTSGRPRHAVSTPRKAGFD